MLRVSIYAHCGHARDTRIARLYDYDDRSAHTITLMQGWLKRADWLVLLLALGMYFAIGAFNLHLPGLQYDEAADAVPALEILRGQAVSSLSHFSLFGRDWPLMMLHHIGPASIYTSLVGFATLGISVESLRIAQLGVGTLSLGLLFWLARLWFGRRVAAIAVLLCASAPAFIWWNRAGANWTAPLLPHALGMMLALTYGWRSKSIPHQRIAVVIAAFLFGAGFTTKILFVWWIAPLFFIVLLAGWRSVWQRVKQLGLPTGLVAFTALLIGLAPFIAHNIPNLDTFRFILSNASQTRLYGHNNLDFLGNMHQVLAEYLRTIGGDTLHFGGPSGLPLGAVLWLIAIGYGVMWLRRPAQHLSRCLVWLSQVAVLPLSTVSTSSIGATYVFMLVPFAWLLMAVVLVDVVTQLQRTVKPLLVTDMVLIALIANHLFINVSLLRFFQQTGGHNTWSDAIYEVADTLQSDYANRPIRAMDWGFSRNLQLLTQKHIDIQERFELSPRPSPEFESLCTVMLRDEPDTVYLFHPPDKTLFNGAWATLSRTAQKLRKQLVVQHIFYERDQTINTLLYAATPMTASFDLPTLPHLRNADIGPGLRLLGGDVTYNTNGRELSVQLHWLARTGQLPDETVLLHIVDQSNGQVVQTGDHRPVYDNYPFTQWQYGEVVTDPYWLTLPITLPAGVYQVRVGVYDRGSGQRRPINDPQQDAAGDSLMLSTFEVQ